MYVLRLSELPATAREPFIERFSVLSVWVEMRWKNAISIATFVFPFSIFVIASSTSSTSLSPSTLKYYIPFTSRVIQYFKDP